MILTKLALFGAISGLALVGGAAAGIFFRMSKKTIGRCAAFGSGVLICALTFGLMDEAFESGGFDVVLSGFFLGGALFILGDILIHFFGGRSHKRHLMLNGSKASNGIAITLGAILDGIPESIALAIAILMGKSLGLLMLVAIVLSNFPESISSVIGLLKAGLKSKRILLIWTIVGFITFSVTVASYFIFHNVGGDTIGFFEAFAAGAILAMLADGMMPEAYEEGGVTTGIVTVLGFLTAFIVAKI